ncbi:MAG: sigma factor [Syntrophales bacterium]
MPARSKTVETAIEDLVEQAKMGNKDVLEEIIRRIQDRLYGLALRMLFIPADAEDATQEILVKIITHLGTFKGESLVDPQNPCRCKTLAALHLKKGQIDPENLLYATHPCHPRREESRPEDLLKELDQISRAAMLIRTHPDYAAPGVFVESMKGLIDSGRFQLLGRQ